MTVVLTRRWPGLGPQDYERLRQELMKEGALPDALRLQVAAIDGTDLVLTEIWESRSAADGFATGRLARAAGRAGLGEPAPAEGQEVIRVLGPAGRPTARLSRRILVVANKTLGSPALEEELRRRAAEGPSLFHLLVPASPISPLGGSAEPDLEDPFLQDQLLQTSLEQARKLLEEHLDGLRRSGIDATGEVGMSDPATAVRLVAGRRRFDEVILSTLPSGLSRWLGMDLPSRLRRILDLPLTVVTAESTD